MDPFLDDPFDIDLRLCDDDGMVSHKPIETRDGELPTLDESYMARHLRLQRMSSRGLEYLKQYPGFGDDPWPCTGHAHMAGLHIRCSSPAHLPS